MKQSEITQSITQMKGDTIFITMVKIYYKNKVVSHTMTKTDKIV